MLLALYPQIWEGDGVVPIVPVVEVWEKETLPGAGLWVKETQNAVTVNGAAITVGGDPVTVGAPTSLDWAKETLPSGAWLKETQAEVTVGGVTVTVNGEAVTVDRKN